MSFQPVKGMRDFLPEEMIKRQFVLDVIRKIFEQWGFQQLDTPILEDLELLTAKGVAGETRREIYNFKDQGGRDLGMRFDLTAPASRVLANNPNLPKPFKRYQFGKVFRYDQPQAGRFREFMQTDIDIFGSSSPESDAEIIACTCDVFKELGFKNFVIRLNNRKILQAFMEERKMEDFLSVFRSIDKLDKIGEEGVKKELEEKKIEKKAIKEILDFIKINGEALKVLAEAEKKLQDKAGIEETKKIIEILKQFGYDKNVKIDLSLVRGLDYYTGPIFEVAVEGGKWSIAGGGRYDRLIKLYGGPEIPATGISLGFERILVLMEENKMFKLGKTDIKVFVAPVNDEVRIEAFKICQKLREKDISCDTDIQGRKLGKQFEYASALGIPFVAIVGKEELKSNSVKLRDLETGQEKIVKIDKIENTLKN